MGGRFDSLFSLSPTPLLIFNWLQNDGEYFSLARPKYVYTADYQVSYEKVDNYVPD